MERDQTRQPWPQTKTVKIRHFSFNALFYINKKTFLPPRARNPAPQHPQSGARARQQKRGRAMPWPAPAPSAARFAAQAAARISRQS